MPPRRTDPLADRGEPGGRQRGVLDIAHEVLDARPEPEAVATMAPEAQQPPLHFAIGRLKEWIGK